MREAFEKAGIKLRISAGDIVTVKDKEIRFPRNLLRKFRERRFCLVMSNSFLCEKYDVISIAPMTTNVEILSEADYEIKKTAENGLEKDCRVELDQIQPILRTWIIQKVGRISSDDWDGVLKQIFFNFRR